MSNKTSDANWAIARARWEGEPRCSYADLADFLGISKQAIGKRAIKDGWVKKLINMTDIAGKAHAIADRSFSHDAVAASIQPPLVDDSPSLLNAPESGADSKNPTPAMLAQSVETAAIDARAQILKRHRTEWTAARNQLYKALKAGDNEQAKLAKLAGETLKLVQEGERKAWGLDGGENEPGQVRIVIERQEGVRVVQ